jgi:hypothetical protein
MMDLIVRRFAEALKWIDSSCEPHKSYRPGVGPYGEPQVAKKAVQYLRATYPAEFKRARTKREPDILVPRRWALELKIVRPFGDNGRPAEHWSENLLHPYAGNVSSLGDCLKLLNSELAERKGVLVLTYEHSPPKVDLGLLIDSFELLAGQILHLRLGPRCSAHLTNLVHPVHQRGTVYGWEVMGTRNR